MQLFELERIINAAVPTAEVQQYLIEHFGYGRSDEWAVPVDIWWPPDKDYANDSTAAPTGQ